MTPLPAIQMLPKPDEGQGDENLEFIGRVMMKKTVKISLLDSGLKSPRKSTGIDDQVEVE